MARWLGLVLLVPLFGLIPLADASPPDPSWIAGFYDNADYDDVVLAATSVAGVVADEAPAVVQPFPPSPWPVTLRDATGPQSAAPATSDSRAPPRV